MAAAVTCPEEGLTAGHVRHRGRAGNGSVRLQDDREAAEIGQEQAHELRGDVSNGRPGALSRAVTLLLSRREAQDMQPPGDGRCGSMPSNSWPSVFVWNAWVGGGDAGAEDRARCGVVPGGVGRLSAGCSYKAGRLLRIAWPDCRQPCGGERC